MSEREAILGRIREALRTPAPRPGLPGPVAHPAARSQPLSAWLPRVGDSFEARATAFQAASAELRSEFHLLASEGEAHARLAALRDFEKWKMIASHRGNLTSSACASLDLETLWTDRPYDPHKLEACEAGLTECDALVAQTGSVVLTSASAGGRAVSILPPHHVVLARREQLVGDLPTALQMLQEKYAPNYPSMISFVTGPSRTGDIERILVLGAHGPKKLTILCY